MTKNGGPVILGHDLRLTLDRQRYHNLQELARMRGVGASQLATQMLNLSVDSLVAQTQFAHFQAIVQSAWCGR